MKKAISIILVILLLSSLLVVSSASVAAESYDGFEYDINADDSVTITKYTGASREVTIPSEINGRLVSAIGNNAFYGQAFMTGIDIPNTITSIGESAFYNCQKLTTIIIPDSVVEIGKNSFCECIGLTNVQLCSGLISIGEEAFYCCNSLKSVTIPDSVMSIGEYAFSGCESLTSIIVDSDNNVFDSRENCNAIIETCSNALLVGCKNTAIPNSVVEIGTHAFFSIGTLNSINIPDSVIHINDYAFANCSGLKNVDLGSGVVQIGENAFRSCSSLEEISIPKSVLLIENAAFYDCKKLDTIEISDSVKWIGSNAFKNTLWLNEKPDGLIYAGKVAYAYKGECPSDISIEEGTYSITAQAFYNCTKLSTLIIPESVVSIGANAFAGTAWYNSQNDGPVYAGKVLYAYKGICPSKVEIEDGTKGIAGNAFFRCDIVEISIPDSVIDIGEFAFDRCKLLRKALLPTNLVRIGNSAFIDCVCIYNVSIPQSVIMLEKKAVGYYYGKNYNPTPLEDFEITGYKDSVANRYANENGFAFIALDNIQDSVLGDVDSDKSVTIVDATFIQRKLASIPIPFEFNEVIADADEDESVTIIDATCIQRWLVGLQTNDNIGKQISK